MPLVQFISMKTTKNQRCYLYEQLTHCITLLKTPTARRVGIDPVDNQICRTIMPPPRLAHADA
ncbi:hypothetical protein FEAC_21040 [Ferrimicrobium acidiphilum DSM 19497]|uniref:Uncharacterized protein n=1 Tax=Ferrimicrobium acidiphilum DSM 19497 TaxID=1121877 RepID=A0A0D8FV40_9ACTN|nr:hypothetical protein FEAC_21040 [Ferrimicrobium acidiphilum DSM 19497]